jgi:hypothetical protein
MEVENKAESNINSFKPVESTTSEILKVEILIIFLKN